MTGELAGDLPVISEGISKWGIFFEKLIDCG
jgi:hypothetical protein